MTRISKDMRWYDRNIKDADWIVCCMCKRIHREYSRGYCYDCFAVLAKIGE